MVNLEYLTIQLPNIRTFNETGIIAPNLKELNVRCDQLSNLEELRQFQHLKELEFGFCNYPFGLFDEDSFPELESFMCWGCHILDSEDCHNSSLIFPRNLKQLAIECPGFENVDFTTAMLPLTLTILHVSGLSFNDGYLGENLRYVNVQGSSLVFKKRFIIFPMVEKFILKADHLTFESLDFMYHLPASLMHLNLFACEQGKMNPLAQKVKWPSMLSGFVFQNFKINYETLKLLNMKESRIEEIDICGGDIKTLDADLFPVSVKDLSLVQMGIEEVLGSFEDLENLQKLSLQGNQLKKISPVRMPVSSLSFLDLKQCNLRLISPFVVSMFEEKNKNVKLRVNATGNLNLNVFDVRRALKASKGLSLNVNNFDKNLIEVSKRSTRLCCEYELPDPYFKESEMEEEVVLVSDYDSDDLYNGSGFDPDEEYMGIIVLSK